MIRSGAVRFHEDLGPLMQPIDSVEPSPSNYNNGDVDEIRASIELLGMYRPVYVQDSTGYILAGNHTWMACKMLGATEIPVVRGNWTDAEATRLMVADNEIARGAKPDNYALVQLLEQIKESDGTLEGTGRTDLDLENLKKLAEIPAEFDEYGSWPTITIQVPPHVKAAYYRMTDVATDERERFELLLRQAGWDGTGRDS